MAERPKIEIREKKVTGEILEEGSPVEIKRAGDLVLTETEYKIRPIGQARKAFKTLVSFLRGDLPRRD